FRGRRRCPDRWLLYPRRRLLVRRSGSLQRGRPAGRQRVCQPRPRRDPWLDAEQRLHQRIAQAGDAGSAGPARERPESRDDRRLPLMSLRTTKARRLAVGSPVRRPAVVEHVDLPQSTSDGRAATLERRGFGAQVRSFVAIGVLSTVAWAVLYAVLRAWMSPVSANGIALVVSAIG